MIERVSFNAPMLKSLNREGFSSVDMHFHTRYSDTFTRVKNILKIAARRGTGFAITDHNAIGGCIEAFEKNKDGTLIIPGIEVSCSEGAHILLYFYSLGELTEFYEKHVKRFKSRNPYMATKAKTGYIVESAARYNSLVAAAHPTTFGLWNIRKRINNNDISSKTFDMIDSMEVINGLMLRRMNRKALEWAIEAKKGITGGSDGHTLYNLGSVVTYSKSDDIGSFLDSIRKRRNHVVGQEVKLFTRIYSHSKMLTKHTKFTGPSLKIHYNMLLKQRARKQLQKANDRMNGK